MSERYNAIKKHLEGTQEETKKGKVMRWKSLLEKNPGKTEGIEEEVNSSFVQKIFAKRGSDNDYSPLVFFPNELQDQLIQKAQDVLNGFNILDDSDSINNAAEEITEEAGIAEIYKNALSESHKIAHLKKF